MVWCWKIRIERRIKMPNGGPMGDWEEEREARMEQTIKMERLEAENQNLQKEINRLKAVLDEIK